MNMDAVIAGRPAGQSAPAAADVEHALARLQPQLAADAIQLLLLGRLQRRIVSGEVGAGIDHLRVEEEAVEVVTDIIVELDEVLVAPPAAITPHPVVARGVPGRQGVAFGFASPQQEG
ncbi:hypothetical protein D3C72_1233250 [compost metagenome]